MTIITLAAVRTACTLRTDIQGMFVIFDIWAWGALCLDDRLRGLKGFAAFGSAFGPGKDSPISRNVTLAVLLAVLVSVATPSLTGFNNAKAEPLAEQLPTDDALRTREVVTAVQESEPWVAWLARLPLSSMSRSRSCGPS